MSAMGHKATSSARRGMSALPSKANLRSALTIVRYVPKAVMRTSIVAPKRDQLFTAHDAIHAGTAFYAAQRGLELNDLVACEQLVDPGGGMECFRDADLSCGCQGLHPRSDIHGLAEIVQVIVQGDRPIDGPQWAPIFRMMPGSPCSRL